jgi:hypothetical protein
MRLPPNQVRHSVNRARVSAVVPVVFLVGLVAMVASSASLQATHDKR